jgi:methionyl aminopeptidase
MPAGDKLAGLLARLRRASNGHSIYPSRKLEPGPTFPAPPVPDHIERPPYAVAAADASSSLPPPPKAPGVSGTVEIFDTPSEMDRMRRVGRLAAAALQLAGRLVEANDPVAAAAARAAPSSSQPTPFLTTDALDRAVHHFLVSHNAYPSPLTYHGFPRSVCVAVNECAAHGVPDGAPLSPGDLVTVDVTAFLGGVHGDTNATFFVGGTKEAAPAAVDLVEATREALRAAIAVCGPGVPFREVGAAVQQVADRAGLSIVRELVGHGIGRSFHGLPAVAHHREWAAKGNKRGVMRVGQTFTIEPILTFASGGRLAAEGPWRRDGWTLVTGDGALAAQFEHTLAIGADGAEVLTTTAEGGGGGGGW